MKKIFKANKLLSIFVLILIFTVAFGIVTRVSYGQSCYDEKKYSSAPINRGGGFGAYADAQEAVNHLDNAPYILVVNRIESEMAFECTKTTVKVKSVIRGDDLSVDDKIIVYEYNNFSTYKNGGEKLFYINRNPANLMINGDDYLIFLYERDLTDAYRKYNPLREFAQFDEVEVVSLFDLSKETQTVYSDGNLTGVTYEDFKNWEFLCFSEESLDILNAIKDAAVSKYLK